MEIIKQGNLPKTKWKKTCHKCKTKFTYESFDINHDRDGHYVVCLNCKAFIAVTP